MTPLSASPSAWSDVPAVHLPAVQRHWLQLQGALTAGLRAQGHVDLTVRREAVVGLTGLWAAQIGQRVGARVWWREILMTVDGVPSVQACSFTPWFASLGAWRAMRGLGSRPLADILYDDPRITRSAFRFGRLRAQRSDTPWVGVHADAWVEARHSVFLRDCTPLLVAEYFLPAFWSVVA